MNKNISYHYMFDGFQNTSLLWKRNSVEHLEQFVVPETSEKFKPKTEDKKLRLGKWVEQFVSFQLQQQSNVNIIEENLQIKIGKQTIGELDLLFLKDKQPFHLEIVYKFYLYDTSKVSANTFDYWIGPNRNDSLTYKLDKLKNKQLPLLYNNETKASLKSFIHTESIKQCVCFKAQLFLPFGKQNISVEPLNKNCISGFYLPFAKIKALEMFQFYIPDKLEWLVTPGHNVSWLNFKTATMHIKEQIEQQRSPMAWLKNEKNELMKCFITWW
ncbi:DUF1853 family protein [Winogradskyella flava]|uniref:DUF1853 family protein n=1 Tax=Winogradskyella flava TaxID=1884876 RepID=UPI002491E45F|nr:DUF1853 family protein [Winogradskyella flava]